MLSKIKIFLFFITSFFITTKNAIAQNEILSLQLDTFILDKMEQFNIPGLSASIVKEGQIVWKGAYGMANIENNIPVDFETEFTLASISKLFTATACAQLWEDGLLDIDADINDYLPITVINPNFPNAPITVRQLLRHKSSLHDSETDLQLWDELGDPIFNLPTFCNDFFIAGEPLYVATNFGVTAPEESSYWYSNAGFTLLGYIVEVVSGMPFNEYCQELILTPLQMNTAGWFYSEVDTLGIAMPYNNSLQPYGYYSVPEYPAAMLKANINELSNFLIAFTQGGVFEEIELFSSITFESLIPEDMTNGFAWWGTDSWWGDSQGNYWSHGGFMNGVRTQLNYYPSDSSGLIILTNGQGSYSAIQNELEAYIPLFEAEENTTDLAEKIEKMDVFIYPNPIVNSEKLTLKFGSPSFRVISIYSVFGKLIERYNSSDAKTEVDIINYKTGIYWIHIESGSSLISKKVVILE